MDWGGTKRPGAGSEPCFRMSVVWAAGGSDEAPGGGASLRRVSHDMLSSSDSLASSLNVSFKEHSMVSGSPVNHCTRTLPVLLVGGKAVRGGRKSQHLESGARQGAP